MFQCADFNNPVPVFGIDACRFSIENNFTFIMAIRTVDLAAAFRDASGTLIRSDLIKLTTRRFQPILCFYDGVCARAFVFHWHLAGENGIHFCSVIPLRAMPRSLCVALSASHKMTKSRRLHQSHTTAEHQNHQWRTHRPAFGQKIIPVSGTNG